MRDSVIPHRIIPFAAALVLAGCMEGAERLPTSLDTYDSPDSWVVSPDQPDTVLSQFAHLFARTLGTPAIRQQVLEDFRDSPFPEHAIHLQSYLTGSRGKKIAQQVQTLQGRGGSIIDGLRSSGDLQISVPVAYDRVEWRGDATAVVIAHTIPPEEVPLLGRVTGYRVGSGAEIEVPTQAKLPYPLIVIAPAQVDYGPNPEEIRSAAVRQSRATISTMEEAYGDATASGALASVLEEECGPDAVIECDEPGGGSGWDSGVRIPSGYTYHCFVSAGGPGDVDGDGILQVCEEELAYAFRPFLQWDLGEEASHKQPYWAARLKGPQEVQIMYLMSYFEDAGAMDLGIRPHDGDSEFMIFTVKYRNGWWRFQKAFLSAHWGVYGWDSSTERIATDFSHPDGNPHGRPKIWIAEDKHGNYATPAQCDAGANWTDNCDQPINGLESLTVMPSRNVGNREGGTTILIDATQRVAYGGTQPEYLWTGSEFEGWQNEHSRNSTSYNVILDHYNF